MTRKILSSVICLLLVASTMFTIACAGDDQTDGVNSGNNGSGGTATGGDTIYDPPGTAASNEIDPAILELDFSDDGNPTELTFVFAERSDTQFTLRSIAPDPESADSVDAANLVRNSTISNALGVTITAYQASDSIQGLQGAINSQMAGQDPEIDVIVGYQYYDINIATQGWVSNLANLKDNDGNKIDYISYDSKSYWGNAYIDALSYKNIVYWVTGDLSLRYIGGIYCTYINKALYEEYLAPTYGSIYDIVKQGNWTMELLYTMADLIYEDVDGNATVNKGDIVGYAWEDNDPIDGLAFGCQVPFSSKSADNSSVSITLSSTRSVTFVGELEKLLYGDHSLYVGNDGSTIVMPIFAEGSVGFTVNKIYHAETYLTNMADDYMIVPVPKLNAEQNAYTTGIHDGCSIYGISFFSDAKAAAAATLEYMAYLSHKDVRPIYYDQALKSKYTNDPTSAEMIDLIHSNISTDFAAAWSASIENIVHWFRTNNKTSGFTRNLNRYAPAQQNALTKLLEDLETYAVD